jgi:hypothetical protein
MSWLYSQALVEEYSAANCSDGEPSAPLSGNPTQLAYLPPDKMTAFSRLSRFGMTFKPLTADRGEALLTLYLADFRAKTLAAQEKGLELMGSAQGCGEKWRGSSARYDPDSRSWKTHQYSLLGGLTEFSETWPRWGLMRNGELFPQQTLVPPTGETESGLLPTLLASLATNGGPNQRDSSGRPGLQMAAMMWPTPTTQDNVQVAGIGKAKGNSKRGTTLGGAVRIWPTPCANETGENPEKLIKRMKKYGRTGSDVHMKLSTYIQMWPTPTCMVGAMYLEANALERNSMSLASAVHHWTTPMARDYKGHTNNPETRGYGGTLPDQVLERSGGGQLNPTWVEWLMGWPLGWTDLGQLEMDRFRSWRQQLLNCSPENKK